MKTWIKYGLLNAVLGFLIGGYVSFTAVGEGYNLLGVAAPLAAFLTGGLLWAIIVRDQFTMTRVIVTGVLTGTIAHYVTFIFMSIAMNICYWTTGNCTGSMGEAPATIASMLTGAFAFSFFSLLFFGWLTIPAAVVFGIILRRTDRGK